MTKSAQRVTGGRTRVCLANIKISSELFVDTIFTNGAACRLSPLKWEFINVRLSVYELLLMRMKLLLRVSVNIYRAKRETSRLFVASCRVSLLGY